VECDGGADGLGGEFVGYKKKKVNREFLQKVAKEAKVLLTSAGEY